MHKVVAAERGVRAVKENYLDLKGGPSIANTPQRTALPFQFFSLLFVALCYHVMLCQHKT